MPRARKLFEDVSTYGRGGRLSNNTAGHYKRGVAIAVQVIFGNSGGAIASNVYRVQDAPRYVLGRESLSSSFLLR